LFIVLAAVAGVLLIAVISLMLVLFGSNPFHRTPPPAGSVPSSEIPEPPAPPGAPGHPGHPEIPPPPAPPGATSGETVSLDSFIYPGAVKHMDITDHGKGVLQLTTNDPIDKVVDWYKAKLKPAGSVQIPFGGMTVLEGKEVKAIITGGSGGTSIMLTRGD